MQNDTKINLIDVGCADYMVEPWKNNYNKINFVLGFDISGTLEYKKYLQRRNIDHMIVKKVVFDKKGSKRLYYCFKSQNSSLFEPNLEVVKRYLTRKKKPSIDRLLKRMKHFTVKKMKKVEAVRLDAEIKKLDIDFDFIKIDTQGAEIEVIRSLGKYLDTQIIGIYAEIFHQEMYHGITLSVGIDKYLKNHNFYKAKTFDRTDKFTSDVLYLKKHSNKKEKMELVKSLYKIK